MSGINNRTHNSRSQFSLVNIPCSNFNDGHNPTNFGSQTEPTPMQNPQMPLQFNPQLFPRVPKAGLQKSDKRQLAHLGGACIDLTRPSPNDDTSSPQINPRTTAIALLPVLSPTPQHPERNTSAFSLSLFPPSSNDPTFSFSPSISRTAYSVTPDGAQIPANEDNNQPHIGLIATSMAYLTNNFNQDYHQEKEYIVNLLEAESGKITNIQELKVFMQRVKDNSRNNSNNLNSDNIIHIVALLEDFLFSSPVKMVIVEFDKLFTEHVKHEIVPCRIDVMLACLRIIPELIEEIIEKNPTINKLVLDSKHTEAALNIKPFIVEFVESYIKTLDIQYSPKGTTESLQEFLLVFKKTYIDKERLANPLQQRTQSTISTSITNASGASSSSSSSSLLNSPSVSGDSTPSISVTPSSPAHALRIPNPRFSSVNTTSRNANSDIPINHSRILIPKQTQIQTVAVVVFDILKKLFQNLPPYHINILQNIGTMSQNISTNIFNNLYTRYTSAQVNDSFVAYCKSILFPIFSYLKTSLVEEFSMEVNFLICIQCVNNCLGLYARQSLENEPKAAYLELSRKLKGNRFPQENIDLLRQEYEKSKTHS